MSSFLLPYLLTWYRSILLNTNFGYAIKSNADGPSSRAARSKRGRGSTNQTVIDGNLFINLEGNGNSMVIKLYFIFYMLINKDDLYS